MKPMLAVALISVLLAACSFRSTTVEHPAPAPSTAVVVPDNPPPTTTTVVRTPD
jgi:uncharacterized lipoprotein YajG